jgi:hypothetical protein
VTEYGGLDVYLLKNLIEHWIKQEK